MKPTEALDLDAIRARAGAADAAWSRTQEFESGLDDADLVVVAQSAEDVRPLLVALQERDKIIDALRSQLAAGGAQ